MEILFSDLISKKERSKEIEYDFYMEKFTFSGEDIVPTDKVLVKGKVISGSNEVLLDLNIKTVLELVCSRCLETFIYPIDIDIEERFTNEAKAQEDDVLVVDGDTLSITEIVESAIVSTLPIKRICSSNCKGLCQMCGTNLNTSSCTCADDSNVDVRLAGLKALLENKEV
ncbi:YceD family protein [uncultured Clostridium sp.]|uniref:YceD family protein n=1 Tax=uncultured Clostridium sp. TaxID=59620 RepID=UPI00261E456F|nr:YceD family protein [uncultured Clostridium sp.]